VARSPPAARHHLNDVRSAGAVSAWARLPDVRRRALVGEGGDVAGAVDCSMEVSVPELIMVMPVIEQQAPVLDGHQHRRHARECLLPARLVRVGRTRGFIRDSVFIQSIILGAG
jgi:hypothetical protein